MRADADDVGYIAAMIDSVVLSVDDDADVDEVGILGMSRCSLLTYPHYLVLAKTDVQMTTHQSYWHQRIDGEWEMSHMDVVGLALMERRYVERWDVVMLDAVRWDADKTAVVVPDSNPVQRTESY